MSHDDGDEAGTEYSLAVMLLNMSGSLVESSWGISPDTGCGNAKAHGLEFKFAAPLIVPWLETVMAKAVVFYELSSKFKDEKEYADECDKLFKKRDAVRDDIGYVRVMVEHQRVHVITTSMSTS